MILDLFMHSANVPVQIIISCRCIFTLVTPMIPDLFMHSANVIVKT
jgi:hypothetical protein